MSLVKKDTNLIKVRAGGLGTHLISEINMITTPKHAQEDGSGLNNAFQPISPVALKHVRHLNSPSTTSGESVQDSDSDMDIKSNSCVSGPEYKVNVGRWTEAEHKLFLKGLEVFPYRAWKKIATLIKTRTVVQIRTHAQKYYQKLAKEEAKGKDKERDHHFITAHHELSRENEQQAMDSLRGVYLKKRKFNHTEDIHFASTNMTKKTLRERKEDSIASTFSRVSSPLSNSVKASNYTTSITTHTAGNAPHTAMNSKSTATTTSPKVKTADKLSSNATEATMTDIAAILPLSKALDFDTPSLIEFSDDKLEQEFQFVNDSAFGDTELLQLTDEDGLDWFSSASTSNSENDSCSMDTSENILGLESSGDCSPVSSPLVSSSTPKKNLFLPIYHCDSFINFESPEYTDEDILDPNTFLESYFKVED